MPCMRLLPAKNISVTQVNCGFDNDDEDDDDDDDDDDDGDDEYHAAVELLLGHLRLSFVPHR